MSDNYQSHYHTNTHILDAKPRYSGYVSKNGLVAAVPLGNSKKFVVVYQGRQYKVCRNYQSALNLCKRLEKSTSSRTGLATLPL